MRELLGKMSRKMRHALLVLTTLGMAVLPMTTAWAQDEEVDDEEPVLTIETLPKLDEADRLRIGFFPRAIPIYLSPTSPVSRDIDVVAIRREILEHLKQIQPFKLVTDQVLHTTFNQSSLEDKDAFAQAEIDMSNVETLAAKLDFDTALVTLERVRFNYHNTLAGYFEPKMVSRAEQVYAYTQLSRLRDIELPNGEDLLKVRRAFMEMIRLTPHIVLLQGRQPQDRVQAYNDAREFFMKNENAVYRRTPTEDAAKLAQKLDLAVIVFLRIVQNDDGTFNAEIDFYERATDKMSYLVVPLNEGARSTASAIQTNVVSETTAVNDSVAEPKVDSSGSSGSVSESSGQISKMSEQEIKTTSSVVSPQSLSLPGMDQELLKVSKQTVEQFSKAINDGLDSLYVGLQWPDVAPVSKVKTQSNRFYLDMSAIYFSYMKHTLDRNLHTLGANVQVSYMFNEHFFARGGITVSGVFRDKQKDLYDTFNIIRLNFYGGVSGNYGWVRPYLAIGVEYSYSSPYAVTESVTCKTFGHDDIECNDYKSNPNPHLFGFDLTVGANFGKEPVYLVVEGFAGVYVLTMSTAWTQVPLGASLGIQYRF